MTVCGTDQIPSKEKAIEEVLCSIILSYVVKSSVGTVGSIEQPTASIILEIDIKIVDWGRFVMKVFKRVLVPYQIHVLKQ